MSFLSEVISVMKEGSEGCKHKFIYNPLLSIYDASKHLFLTSRVCEKCGRYEKVKTNYINSHNNGFDETLNKFNYI